MRLTAVRHCCCGGLAGRAGGGRRGGVGAAAAGAGAPGGTQHLVRFLGIICDSNALADDPLLAAHLGTTLLDLVTLALGAGRDAAHLARMRGVRSARLQEIIAEIKVGYADAALSPASVASKVGLSPRYLHELLQETGVSFTERVLELRLQKARALLSDPRHDRRKVSEIALACGFGDISYFNRAFRRRFDAIPSQLRGRADPPA